MREAGVESLKCFGARGYVGRGVWVFEPCGVPSRPGASPSAPPACVRFVIGTAYAPFVPSSFRALELDVENRDLHFF